MAAERLAQRFQVLTELPTQAVAAELVDRAATLAVTVVQVL
jgi:hypothetical protein